MLTSCTQENFVLSILWLSNVVITHTIQILCSKFNWWPLMAKSYFCLTRHNNEWVLDKVTWILQPCKTRVGWYHPLFNTWMKLQIYIRIPVVQCHVFRMLVFIYTIISSNYYSYCLWLGWKILSISSFGPECQKMRRVQLTSISVTIPPLEILKIQLDLGLSNLV